MGISNSSEYSKYFKGLLKDMRQFYIHCGLPWHHLMWFPEMEICTNAKLMDWYRWVVMMQKTTMVHETTYRHLWDLIHDQHSWSMYPLQSAVPMLQTLFHQSICSVLYKAVFRYSSMFNLQCSVFSLQVFLCWSAVCGHKCILKLDVYSVTCKAGDVISNSTWVIWFCSDSVPHPLPVRTLAAQLPSTSSQAQPTNSD